MTRPAEKLLSSGARGAELRAPSPFPSISWNASFHQDSGSSSTSTGSRRTEGFISGLFFSKSHRENPRLVLFAADSGAAPSTQNSFWTRGKNLPKRGGGGGEETGAAAPIKAFAYTFPTWVLPKKMGGNFCKKEKKNQKKAFFDSGMATTMIGEDLSRITNCSLLKKGGSSEVSCLCLVPSSQEFHLLCLLEVRGKGAGGGGSIQSRQSEWAVTVQH